MGELLHLTHWSTGMSISAQVLDYYDDVDRQYLNKLASPTNLRDVPMHDLSPSEHASLRDSSFGLVVLTKQARTLRRFPVSDPGNAWLSAQYFQNTHTKLAYPARFVAAKFIKEACKAYHVPSTAAVDAYAANIQESDHVDSNLFQEGTESSWMLKKMAQSELLAKQASAAEVNALVNMPDAHFAIVLQDANGEVTRKYAMPDAAHVKKAADYCDKYAMQMEPTHRHRFASSVQRRATELAVDVSGHFGIQKWASNRWNRHVDYHLEQRKSLLPLNPNARSVLDKLASDMRDTDPATAAEALETFDQATGLDKYYDRGLQDPYASIMDKTALAWSADIDGETITAADLKKVASSGKLKRYLGEAFASQFEKNATEIFESLPDPTKVLIKQIVFGEA